MPQSRLPWRRQSRVVWPGSSASSPAARSTTTTFCMLQRQTCCAGRSAGERLVSLTIRQLSVSKTEPNAITCCAGSAKSHIGFGRLESLSPFLPEEFSHSPAIQTRRFQSAVAGLPALRCFCDRNALQRLSIRFTGFSNRQMPPLRGGVAVRTSLRRLSGRCAAFRQNCQCISICLST